MSTDPKEQIAALFQQALTPHLAGNDLSAPAIILERPRDPSHGDFACNIAMQLAKALKKNPRELAQAIAQDVMGNPLREGLIANVEIAGPGFMNVNLRIYPHILHQC